MRFLSLAAVAGIAALSVASMVGCAAPTDEPAAPADPATSDGAAEEVKALVIDESSNNKTVKVALGRSFTIALADNGASTGYTWNVKSVDRTIGQPKVATVPGNPKAPGSAGLKKFTWSTKSPLDLAGKHVITLENQRPWAETSPPAATFKVTINIESPVTPAMCGGIAGLSCAKGQYCEFAAAASCGGGDQSGTCNALPELCPMVVMPVCGCDNKTYNNSCEANRAGASLRSAGPCVKAN
jgi:predicted secreted protein